MRLKNPNAEIEKTVFDVLTTIESIVQTVIGDKANPPGGDHYVLVMRQNARNKYKKCYPQTDLKYPPYIIRLCCCEDKLKAAAAYEFAHELCHVWLGAGHSNALAEVLCECASWYFTHAIQVTTGIPYRRDVLEPYPNVTPNYDTEGKLIVPLEEDPNHEPEGRMAMVRLAKDHLVYWMFDNPELWTLLPQIGAAMGRLVQSPNWWNSTVNWDAIINELPTDSEKVLLNRFKEQFEMFAVFQ